MKKLLPLFLASACAHDDALPTKRPDIGEGLLAWDEIVHFNENTFEPNVKLWLEDLLISRERLEMLPEDLRNSPDLAQLALNRAIEHPQRWESGVSGYFGNAKVYVTTKDRIRDYEQLYVIMVRMLSEKYGCLMIEKQNYSDETTRVRCRDHRQILLWRSTGPSWIQFHARQFDRHGYEIVVRKRQIVRVSDVKTL